MAGRLRQAVARLDERRARQDGDVLRDRRLPAQMQLLLRDRQGEPLHVPRHREEVRRRFTGAILLNLDCLPNDAIICVLRGVYPHQTLLRRHATLEGLGTRRIIG